MTLNALVMYGYMKDLNTILVCFHLALIHLKIYVKHFTLAKDLRLQQYLVFLVLSNMC